MTKQIELIGTHPNEDHPLGDWLNANDIPVTAKVLQDPHFYADELKNVNIVREWQNPKNQTYTLFDEKFVGNWRWFCEENNFVKDSKYGLAISKSLGEIYMTFLAQEVAYEKEASPITDSKFLDELSIKIRAKRNNGNNTFINP